MIGKECSTNRAASLVTAWLLLVPIAAVAQPAPAGPTPAGPTPVVATGQHSVERQINDMRRELGIAPALAREWDSVADAMRQEARNTAQLAARQQAEPAMNGVATAQLFSRMAAVHDADMQRFLLAFETLYNRLSSAQRKRADQLVREYLAGTAVVGGG
jgi:hypothetical protein